MSALAYIFIWFRFSVVLFCVSVRCLVRWLVVYSLTRRALKPKGRKPRVKQCIRCWYHKQRKTATVSFVCMEKMSHCAKKVDTEGSTATRVRALWRRRERGMCVRWVGGGCSVVQGLILEWRGTGRLCSECLGSL